MDAPDVITIDDDEDETAGGGARGLTPRQRGVPRGTPRGGGGVASDATGVLSAHSPGDVSGGAAGGSNFASRYGSQAGAPSEQLVGGDDDGAFMDAMGDEGLGDDDEGGAFPGGGAQHPFPGEPFGGEELIEEVEEEELLEAEEVPRSEAFVFPPHVRAQLAGRQAAFRPAPRPNDLRLGFEALRVRPSGAAMHACKLGCAAMLLPGYTEHSDAGVRAAAEAFRVRDVRSRVAVARVPPGNPAYPGLGAFAAAPLPAFKAVCQYAGVVLLDAEANAKQAAALATAAADAAAAGAAAAVLTCFVDTPAGGTVIDGAPANRPRSTCSFVNDGRVGPGQPARQNNVALLPVTCPGCASCPGLLHQHMVLITLVPVAKGAELLLDYGAAYWRLHDELVARAAALVAPPATPPPPLGLATLALGAAELEAMAAAGDGAGGSRGAYRSEPPAPARLASIASAAAAELARAPSGSSADGRGVKRARDGWGIPHLGVHPSTWSLPWNRRPDLDFSCDYVKPPADAARLEAAGLLWPAEGSRAPRRLRYLDGRALLAARCHLEVPEPGVPPPSNLPPLRPAAAAALARAEARAARRTSGTHPHPHPAGAGGSPPTAPAAAAAFSPRVFAQGGACAPAAAMPPAPRPPLERLRNAEALAEVLAGEPGCTAASVAALWEAIQACISASNPPRADGASYRFHVVDYGSGPDAAYEAFGAMFSPPQRAAEVARACSNAARAAKGADGPTAQRVRAAAAAAEAAPGDMRASLRLAAVAFGMSRPGDDVAAPPHLCIAGLDAGGSIVAHPPLHSFSCARTQGPCGFVLRFGERRVCALLWRLAGAAQPAAQPAAAAPAVARLDSAGVSAAAARERTRAHLLAAEVARDAAFAAAAAASQAVAQAAEALTRAQDRQALAQQLLKAAADARAAAAAADQTALLALSLHARG